MKKSQVFLTLFLFLLTIATSHTFAQEEDDQEEDSIDFLEESDYWDSESSEIEEINAEDDETEVFDGKSNVLGGKPIEINISPVNPEDFSCLGATNGNQVDPNPKDCLAFYVCVNETAYKIHCPKIPDQTYYNPAKKACDNCDADFCKDFVGLSKDDDEEEEDYYDFDGGEIYEDRDEL